MNWEEVNFAYIILVKWKSKLKMLWMQLYEINLFENQKLRPILQAHHHKKKKKTKTEQPYKMRKKWINLIKLVGKIKMESIKLYKELLQKCKEKKVLRSDKI